MQPALQVSCTTTLLRPGSGAASRCQIQVARFSEVGFSRPSMSFSRWWSSCSNSGLKGLLQVGKIHHPATVSPHRASHVHLDAEGMAVHAGAFVPCRHMRKEMRRFDLEYPENVHGAHCAARQPGAQPSPAGRSAKKPGEGSGPVAVAERLLAGLAAAAQRALPGETFLATPVDARAGSREQQGPSLITVDEQRLRGVAAGIARPGDGAVVEKLDFNVLVVARGLLRRRHSGTGSVRCGSLPLAASITR